MVTHKLPRLYCLVFTPVVSQNNAKSSETLSIYLLRKSMFVVVMRIMSIGNSFPSRANMRLVICGKEPYCL